MSEKRRQVVLGICSELPSGQVAFCDLIGKTFGHTFRV